MKTHRITKRNKSTKTACNNRVASKIEVAVRKSTVAKTMLYQRHFADLSAIRVATTLFASWLVPFICCLQPLIIVFQ